MDHRWIVNYRIDATGRLRGTSSQAVDDAHQITGEPMGRVVYMAYGPRTAEPPYKNIRSTIVAYLPNGEDGSLAAFSEASSEPLYQSQLHVSGGWRSLTAGTDRVYGIWMTETYCCKWSVLVNHAVRADGQLGEGSGEGFDKNVGGGLVNTRTHLYYHQEFETLLADSVGADGRLTSVGRSSFGSNPVASARQFLFAWRSVNDKLSLHSFEGEGLEPRANLGFGSAWVWPFEPNAASDPVLLAVPASVVPSSGGDPRHELRLYALRPDGGVDLRTFIETSASVTSALFHPAGRFLFATVGTSLEVYSYDTGHLTRVDSVPASAGLMAVTSASAH